MSRRLIHVGGCPSWGREQVRRALLGGDRDGHRDGPGDDQWRMVWLGDGAPQGVYSIALGDYQRVLGSTQDIIVYDAHAGLDPDALAAVTGALRGGGILILLTPEPVIWPSLPDTVLDRLIPAGRSGADAGSRFIQRLVDLLNKSPWVERYRAGEVLPRLSPAAPTELSSDSLGCCSSAQRSAVAAIMRVVTGHRRRPLVLSADRGRGKSAALGIAVGELLAAGKVAYVVVTAPCLAAVEPVFEHALQHCAGQRVARREVSASGGRLCYQSPQELGEGHSAADLMIVDEAAGLPVALLTRLLQEQARIVFATTVHGYEGTGRGFDLRFRSVLDAQTPEWRLQRLEIPIRWSSGDRLEAWLTDALLLDAEIAGLDKGGAAGKEHAEQGTVLEKVDRDALVADETRLRQGFGLLVAAHYRTRPVDLRQWLDAPGIEIYWALRGGEVVGILVAAHEGGLEAQLATQIWRGSRRLRGHLLSQMLSTHAGVERAPKYSALRILRIAVHPQLRRCAIGSALVKTASEHAAAVRCSIFGTSFGGTTDLVGFWRSCGLSSVALGVQREAASGEYAVLMAKGLDDIGQEVIIEAGERLRSVSSALLGEPLDRLDPVLALQIFAATSGPAGPRLPSWQERDLMGFAYGQRGYAASLAALMSLAEFVLSNPEIVDRAAEPNDVRGGYCATAALVAKVLQRKEWHCIAGMLGCHGRQSSIKQLRRQVAYLLEST